MVRTRGMTKDEKPNQPTTAAGVSHANITTNSSNSSAKSASTAVIRAKKLALEAEHARRVATIEREAEEREFQAALAALDAQSSKRSSRASSQCSTQHHASSQHTSKSRVDQWLDNLVSTNLLPDLQPTVLLSPEQCPRAAEGEGPSVSAIPALAQIVSADAQLEHSAPVHAATLGDLSLTAATRSPAPTPFSGPFGAAHRDVLTARNYQDTTVHFDNQAPIGGCFGPTQKKTIVGSWGWAWWLVTDVQRISLEVMTLNPICEYVETAQGVPLTVTGVAQCKIMNEDELLTTACEQFLGKTVKEVKMTVLQTLEGHLRAILGTLTVEEVYKDRDQFAALVREVAAPDVGRMGIEILSFTIKDVYDDVQYLASLGKSQTAVVKRDADVGVAQANRDAGIREAECEKTAMDVKYSTDTKIEDNARMFKLQKAQFDQEVNTAKAEAALAYELQAAKIKQRIRNEEIQIEVVERRKQIEVEHQEILRREEELNATVRLPAASEAYRLQAIAEGKRTQTVEAAKADAERIKVVGLAEANAIGDVGKADAERMLARAKVYKQYGEAAIMALVLEALPKIAAEVSAPLAKTDEIVLVGDSGATGEVARLASGVPPALKTLTGIDVVQMLKRLQPNNEDSTAVSPSVATGKKVVVA